MASAIKDTETWCVYETEDGHMGKKWEEEEEAGPEDDPFISPRMFLQQMVILWEANNKDGNKDEKYGSCIFDCFINPERTATLKAKPDTDSYQMMI